MEHNLSTSNSRTGPGINPAVVNIIKITAFLALALGILLFFECLLQNNDSVTERKRKVMNLGPEEVDVLFIGNSHAYCSFNPVVIEEQLEVRAFNAGLPDQKIDTTYYNLLDLLERQSPETIVLEAFTFGRSTKEYQGYVANIDAMDFGIRKLEACFSIFSDPWEAARMSFRVFRSHNNWKKPDIMKSNIKYFLGIERESFATKGFHILQAGMSQETIDKYKAAEDLKFTPVIDEYSIGYFNQILKVCKERNIRLIVAMAPFNSIYLEKIPYGEIFEKMQRLCDDAGVEYIDFNIFYNEIGLSFDDFEDAFHNAQHTNIRGAEKISRYMGQYLSKTP